MLVSLQFARSRVSYSCSSTCLTKAGRVGQGCPCRRNGNLTLLRNSNGTKDVERRPYILFSSSFHGRLSPQISFCNPHPTVFFVFFFLPLDTNRLRGESDFRPEPLRKPPYEPSRVDIQFYYNFKKLYTDIPLELSKDDQVLLLQGFNDAL